MFDALSILIWEKISKKILRNLREIKTIIYV